MIRAHEHGVLCVCDYTERGALRVSKCYMRLVSGWAPKMGA